MNLIRCFYDFCYCLKCHWAFVQSLNCLSSLSASRWQREHNEGWLGVPAGHIGAGAVQTENPAGSQFGLPQRAEGSATDRRQEGEANPGLEGDPRSLHKG